MTREWKFVLCSDNSAMGERLREILGEQALGRQIPASIAALSEALEQEAADVVFVDFGACDASGCAQCDLAVALTQTVAQQAPEAVRVAIGRSEDSQSVIRALRAGVHEFVDLTLANEVQDTLQRALQLSRPPAGLPHAAPSIGQQLLIMGARPGVGASTLGVYTAIALQKKRLEQYRQSHPDFSDLATLPIKQRVCLVDLGWPTGESNLYLNLASEFSFIDASRQLHRIDDTLLKTALAQHSSGMNIISLPMDPNAVRSASLKDCLQLCQVLARHYGVVIIEANGFPNREFLKQLAQSVDQSWLVTDQNMASLIAVADVLSDFDEHPPKLVLNRYDARAGLTAKEIAERFKLALLGVLPDRGWEMIKATNLAELISAGNERDPFNKAIAGMAATLYREAEPSTPVPSKAKTSWLTRWVSHSR